MRDVAGPAFFAAGPPQPASASAPAKKIDTKRARMRRRSYPTRDHLESSIGVRQQTHGGRKSLANERGTSLARRAGMRSFLPFVAGALVACASPLGSSSSGIVGGELDTQTTGVVMVYIKPTAGGWGTCSGTVVSPHVVVTAAHC